MFKALASLAAAMTGGAGLLAWLEPSSPSRSDPPALAAEPVLSRDLARRLVQSGPARSPNRWRAIEVVALAGPTPATEATLTATLPRNDLHFLVPDSGDMRALPIWRKQRSVASDRIIRIGVTAGPEDGRISSTQWLALRALLAELSEQTAATGSLPVRLATTHGASTGQGRSRGDHLRALLLNEGLLS